MQLQVKISGFGIGMIAYIMAPMLHVLMGPDEFERRQRLHQLLGDNWVRRSVEDGLGAMLTMIGQADLFGGTPQVVLNNVFSLRSDEQTLLAETLTRAKSLEQVVIIELEDADWPNIKGPLLEILQQASVEVFAAPVSGQVVQWLSKQAMTMGVQVDKPLLPVMASQLGHNKLAIMTELERLKWRSEPVTETILNELLPMGGEMVIFGVMDSWAQQQVAVTLNQLRQLWRQQTAPQIVLSLFERQARLLYIVKQFNPPISITGKLGLQPFMVARLKKWTLTWSVEQLQQALLDLADLDRASKSGGLGLEFGLESWVITSINKELALQVTEVG